MRERLKTVLPFDLAPAVVLLSAAALAYEILLTRVFAITEWHHLSFLVVSTALLGFGASGTVLALFGRSLLRRVEVAMSTGALLFAVSAILSLWVAGKVPFNALEIPWSASPIGWQMIQSLTLSIPFLVAATALGLALIARPERIGPIYGANLLGAGIGSAATLFMLFHLPPSRAVEISAAVGAMGGALIPAALHRPNVQIWLRGANLAIAVALFAGAAEPMTELSASQYKPLSQHLRVAGAERLSTHSSPFGVVDVVRNHVVPFRSAPGLSLHAPSPVPEQIALFVDGDGPVMVDRGGGPDSAVEYHRWLTSAAPFGMLAQPSVLVIGSGGGTAVRQALAGGARRVDAVELHPKLVEIVRDELGAFSGHVYNDPRVEVHVSDGRGYVARTQRRYDLIQLIIGGTTPGAGPGLSALQEDRLHTVEATRTFIDRLAPGGILAITLWIRLPPRESARMFATVVQAMEEVGAADPETRLAWIRGWQTSTILVKNGGFEATELDELYRFARTRGFDVAYPPRPSLGPANHFNRLPQPYFQEIAVGLLGNGREELYRRYKFDIRPTTDNRPYFHLLLKWAHASEIFALRTMGGVGLLEIGYLMLVITVAQAAIGGLVLILLPLRFISVGAAARKHLRGQRSLTFTAFAGLGLAFLCVEMGFIAKLTVVLSHPVYAIVLAVTGFLVFAGIGSVFGLRHRQPDLVRPITALIIVGVGYALGIDVMYSYLAALSLSAKCVVSLLAIAPLAVLMGVPFPTLLSGLAKLDAPAVPWAWGINGCASVVAAAAAPLVAVHLGLNALLWIAMATYLVVGVTGSRLLRARAPCSKS